MFNPKGATMSNLNFEKGVVIKIGLFPVTVKKVYDWYCVYITVPYIEGCNDVGTFCERKDNGKCVIGEDTAKSWLNPSDFASVYIMANALIENYCAMVDEETKNFLSVIAGK